MRHGPPFIGWAMAAIVPSARRSVRANLHRVRGPTSPLRDARDVLATFGTFASCVAEVLSNEAPGGPKRPRALIHGERHVRAAIAARRGVVLVTAHTAGWDIVGPLLGADFQLDLVLVTHAEPDARAGDIQDEARRRSGVKIARVGDDPLASLPLLRHLRGGGVVALQLDRVVPGMRTRRVPLLGREGELPEGPFRLAAASGAPVLPVFCARRGHRSYLVEAFEPQWIARRAPEADVDRAAATVAAAMTRFLRAHPTQWFQFGNG
ncbi:MAG: lysophospholipid acyltransferase family protein [Labilithrix sp.]|nr:lysophospholipid acyltransferase family protein [Labilithrix sp.]MCW5814246.1 lysophospholipid acyltransferase family protein [Labilithrix sp.]